MIATASASSSSSERIVLNVHCDDNEGEEEEKDSAIEMELQRRRGDERTYTEPLERLPERKPFFKEFYRTIHTPEKKRYYRQQREQHSEVDKLYRKLCGRNVSFEDFWQRYEYRCNYSHIQYELRMGQPEEGEKVGGENNNNNNNSQCRKPWTSVIENGGVSPTDVKDDSQLLFDRSTINQNKMNSGINEHNRRPSIENSSGKEAVEILPSCQGMTVQNDDDRPKCSRRKSRLAKLVEAKKQKRKAQKAKEKAMNSNIQKGIDESMENIGKGGGTVDVMDGLGADREAKESKPTAVVGGGDDSVAMNRSVLKESDAFYDDDDNKYGPSEDKCECNACVVM
jgi:hypothetical protein